MDIPIVLPHSFRNPEAESLMHRQLMDDLLFAEAGVQVLEHDLMPVDVCVLTFIFLFHETVPQIWADVHIVRLQHPAIAVSTI